ncbi:hypothetical protein F4680DRAFT_441425 [Xylaria scruposa]|nr:hypothetical protein F4680DRAFT_441425 [Xylaria scruposa]
MRHAALKMSAVLALALQVSCNLLKCSMFEAIHATICRRENVSARNAKSFPIFLNSPLQLARRYAGCQSGRYGVLGHSGPCAQNRIVF